MDKQPAPSKNHTWLKIIAFLIIAPIIWFVVAAPDSPLVSANMQSIHDKVVTDALAQFDIVKESGSAVDKCVQAGMVKAALLQAQDAKGYASWTQLEEQLCKSAGLNR